MGVDMKFVTKSVTTMFYAHNPLQNQGVKGVFYRFLLLERDIYRSYCHQIGYNRLILLPKKPVFMVVTKVVTN
jgi:hypothetical protein